MYISYSQEEKNIINSIQCCWMEYDKSPLDILECSLEDHIDNGLYTKLDKKLNQFFTETNSLHLDTELIIRDTDFNLDRPVAEALYYVDTARVNFDMKLKTEVCMSTSDNFFNDALECFLIVYYDSIEIREIQQDLDEILVAILKNK